MTLTDRDGARVLGAVRTWLAGGSHEPLAGAAWKLAELHGVGGLLGWSDVRGGDVTSVGAARYFSTVLAYERAARLLDRVVGACVAGNIPVALVKGPALVTQAYGDGGLRGFGDIDLLVPDRAAALALADAIGGAVDDKDQGGFMTALRNPGKVTVVVDGVEIEMLFPVAEPSDGMLDLLSAHPGVLRVPVSVQDLCDPEPSFHLLFLLLHMLTNHFCGRLVWFVDLVLFLRNQGGRIDWNFVERELGRLGMVAAAERVLGFCERRLDPSLAWRLPRVAARHPAFLDCMTEAPVVMRRSMGVQYVEGWQRRAVQFAYIGGFLLLSDRGAEAASRYTEARMRRAIGRFVFLPRWFGQWPAWVIGRSAAWVTEHVLLGVLANGNGGGQRCEALS